jgi:hypothetical protein
VRRTYLHASVLLITVLIGCRSHVVSVTIHNATNATLRNVEFQYPGGSFGRNVLAPGESYTYRIKVMRSGSSVLNLDANGTLRTKTGPSLQANSEGALQVEVTSSYISFTR